MTNFGVNTTIFSIWRNRYRGISSTARATIHPSLLGGRFGPRRETKRTEAAFPIEIFGPTTVKIPASRIQELQLSLSSPEVSTELTSSGAVDVTILRESMVRPLGSFATVHWLRFASPRPD